MSKRNNLHSFTLWPKASAIVSKIKRGRKSQFVSKAIIWFDTPQGELARELDQRIEDHKKLIVRFAEAQKYIIELEKSQSFISKMRKKFKK